MTAMRSGTVAPEPRAGRVALRRLVRPVVLLSLVAALGFALLGLWQVERRAWKLDLIARVDARLAAAPAPAPGRAEWPSISQAHDEYRRVTVSGRFLPGRSVRVMAVTALGPGSWLLSPLVTAAGDTILVNRGFVPAEWLEPASDGDQPVTIAGLLRMPEPGGGFLRRNDPAADRWFSRDVAAIAAAHGLGPVAPFFIDADAARNGPARPVGGLTIIAFHNAHLVYALTWFGLAGLAGFAAFRLARDAEN